jgi:hypothetical protein
MGSWARGTPQATLKQMNMVIAETRRRATRLQNSSAISAGEIMESEDLLLSHADKRKGKMAVARELPKESIRRRRTQFVISDLVEAGAESSAVGSSPPLQLPTEESDSEYATGDDSDSPPPKKPKTVMNVVVPPRPSRQGEKSRLTAQSPAAKTPTAAITKAPIAAANVPAAFKTPTTAAKTSSAVRNTPSTASGKKPVTASGTPGTQSSLLRFFGMKQDAGEQANDGSPITDPAISAAKAKMRASVVSSGQDNDDMAAAQLRAETTPKVKVARSVEPPVTGQKRRRTLNPEKITHKAIEEDETDELLASGSSPLPKSPPKTPHLSTSGRGAGANLSVKKAAKVSIKKRQNTSTQPAEYEVENVVGHRYINGMKQYFVKWLGFPSSNNTYTSSPFIPPPCSTDNFFQLGT